MNKENAPMFNQVGYKDINNYWWKHKYDDNNNIVEEVNSNGFTVTKEYNENGCILKQSDSLGIIKTFEYDERNNLIYMETTCKDKIIDAYWAEYNEKDLMIYEKRDGYDTFYKYNENGDIISKTSQSKLSYSVEYEYLDNIKKEHKIYSDGKEVWITTNTNEHSISFKDNRGCKWDKKFDENGDVIKYYEANDTGFDLNEYEHILEYDENNNLIHHKVKRTFSKMTNAKYDPSIRQPNRIDGVKETEVFHTYDENNNLIHSITDSKFEDWFEYDENNNLIHRKNSSGLEYWNEWEAAK